MDDLYNAVEDVKLMNAMTDDPHPTKEWTLPTPMEVREREREIACVRLLEYLINFISSTLSIFTDSTIRVSSRGERS